MLGVYDRKWVEPMAEALKNLGSVHAWVVHGSDGMDELTTTGPSTVAELHGGDITVFEVTPEHAGLPRATLSELKGGDAQVNAAKMRALFLGETGPYRDIVLLQHGCGAHRRRQGRQPHYRRGAGRPIDRQRRRYACPRQARRGHERGLIAAPGASIVSGGRPIERRRYCRKAVQRLAFSASFRCMMTTGTLVKDADV